MKKTHIAGIIAIAVAIAAMIITLGDSSAFVTFDEAEKYPERDFHVIGVLAPGKPIDYNPLVDPNSFSFYLEDKNGNVRKVFYNDAKPQDFERSDEVVIIGKATAGDFMADRILMKCPSKYTEEFVDAREASDTYPDKNYDNY